MLNRNMSESGSLCSLFQIREKTFLSSGWWFHLCRRLKGIGESKKETQRRRNRSYGLQGIPAETKFQSFID